jgi:hypothetical protein
MSSELEVGASLQQRKAARNPWPGVETMRSYKVAHKDVNMEAKESTVLEANSKQGLVKE